MPPSRANRRPRVEVWPIAIDQPLPVVPVPLLSDDPDSSLDLQLVYQTIYELFGYDQATDHSDIPLVSLAPDQEAWVIARLQAAGLR